MKIENAVAVVTGANRGIGLAFANELLARGLNAPKSSPEDVVRRALDGLASGLDEVLADELTQQVKRGMTAARPSYLPQNV
jgi:NAD(P)-dependent dehydrogenase (short-subunit alcohol dehydrogenase family)